MQKIDGTSHHVIIDDETLIRIDAIAKREGIRRAQAIRNLLAFGADVYEDLTACGIVKMVEVFREAKHRITPVRRKVWDATR